MDDLSGSSERDVERAEFVIEPTKQVDLRYRRILYEMDEDVTRVEDFIPTYPNTTMADEHIEIERVPVEESQYCHKFIYNEIEGEICGTDYEECLEGAKIIIEAHRDVVVDVDNISIPSFE